MNPLAQLNYYYEAGGWIVLPLFLLTVLLWYALGYRFAVLRGAGSRRSMREQLQSFAEREPSERPRRLLEGAMDDALTLAQADPDPEHLRRHLDATLWPYYRELRKYRVLITTTVATAPLLGLLGTVTGMIETFDSLQEMALFTQSGGIAGGISQALITTQFGLAVAIPGLFINSFIDRRMQHVEVQLNQLKDLICVRMKESKPI